MRTALQLAVLVAAASTSSCVNPLHQGGVGGGPGQVAPSNASMRDPWGADANGWVGGAHQPAAPEANPLGWGNTAAGDRAPTSARTVPPGSSGAGFTNAGGAPLVDVQRGLDGPVDAQPIGTVSEIDGPARNSVEDTSRASLFREFDRLEDDRNALRQQLADMQLQFDRLTTQAAQQAALAQNGQNESLALRARIEQLEEHNRQLALENEDLAGRLLTAQIRRLEAEKALLEQLIANEQALGNAARSATNGAPANGTPSNAQGGANNATNGAANGASNGGASNGGAPNGAAATSGGPS
jgi:regulator of replication initiation timing